MIDGIKGMIKRWQTHIYFEYLKPIYDIVGGLSFLLAVSSHQRYCIVLSMAVRRAWVYIDYPCQSLVSWSSHTLPSLEHFSPKTSRDLFTYI